jgi:hypothetical protein
MTTFVSRRLNMLCLVFNISVVYNNADRSAMCEGWQSCL